MGGLCCGTIAADARHERHTRYDPSGPGTPAARFAEQAELDYVPMAQGFVYLVRFAAPEFTSLCPVTSQPDFAHLVIDYAPGETIVDRRA